MIEGKKKIISICVIIITIILYVVVRSKVDLYFSYKNDYQAAFFEKEEWYVKEHKPNRMEKHVGNELVDLEKMCFNENKTDYRLGEVNDFFGCSSEGKYIGLDFLTCKIEGDRGVIWVKYIKHSFDKNNLTEESEGDCGPMLWKMEKKNGEWVVTKIKWVRG